MPKIPGLTNGAKRGILGLVVREKGDLPDSKSCVVNSDKHQAPGPECALALACLAVESEDKNIEGRLPWIQA